VQQNRYGNASICEEKMLATRKMGYTTEENNNKMYNVEHCSLLCWDVDNDTSW